MYRKIENVRKKTRQDMTRQDMRGQKKGKVKRNFHD